MHRDDYGVLAAEHRVARDAQQVEQVALAVAAAIAQDSRRFDPVEFLLAACGAATIGQLSAPMRGHVAEIFRTSEPRQRPGPAPELRPDELIDTSRWTLRHPCRRGDLGCEPGKGSRHGRHCPVLRRHPHPWPTGIYDL
jgi:hypothetical protein